MSMTDGTMPACTRRWAACFIAGCQPYVLPVGNDAREEELGFRRAAAHAHSSIPILHVTPSPPGAGDAEEWRDREIEGRKVGTHVYCMVSVLLILRRIRWMGVMCAGWLAFRDSSETRRLDFWIDPCLQGYSRHLAPSLPNNRYILRGFFTTLLMPKVRVTPLTPPLLPQPPIHARHLSYHSIASAAEKLLLLSFRLKRASPGPQDLVCGEQIDSNHRATEIHAS